MKVDQQIAAVLTQLRAAAGGFVPVVTADYPLGPRAIRVDLAILADEFIAVLVDDGIVSTEERLATACRYFDRVVLVVDGEAAVQTAPSAAIWTIGTDGDVIEHQSGSINEVSINACFDLLPAEARRRLLERLTSFDPAHARGSSTLIAGMSLDETRADCAELFVAAHGERSAAFWAAVEDRAIDAGDVGLLRPRAQARAALTRSLALSREQARDLFNGGWLMAAGARG